MAQLISQCLHIETAHQETGQLSSQWVRGGSNTAAASYGTSCDNNTGLETFNYYHKVLHPRRLSSPTSNSANRNYLVSKYAIENRKMAKTNWTIGVNILKIK